MKDRNIMIKNEFHLNNDQTTLILIIIKSNSISET